MDISDNVCLSVLIPLASITDTVDDRVNPALKFYIINNQNGHKVSTDDAELAYCMGALTEPDDPEYTEEGELLNPVPVTPPEKIFWNYELANRM